MMRPPVFRTTSMALRKSSQRHVVSRPVRSQLWLMALKNTSGTGSDRHSMSVSNQTPDR